MITLPSAHESIGTKSARTGVGHARISWIGSAAGGGWTSHDPSPGGVMEGGRRC